MGRTYHWCLVLATVSLIGSGCGSKGQSVPVPKVRPGIRVTGPWQDGGRIPARFTCDGAGRVPAVAASPTPGAEDLVTVMTDPDAPGGTFVHWTRWGTGTEGRNSFGKIGYSGPCPPKGDKPHHYVITFYALRRALGLPAGSPPDKVLAAVKAKAFASGSLTGLYGR